MSECIIAKPFTALRNLRDRVKALEANAGSGGGGTAGISYQVGDLYITTSATSKPAAIFGGTWEQIKDRFLLAAGDTYAAGSTGGEATHTLTADEMPKHRHDIYAEYSSGDIAVPMWGTYSKNISGDNYIEQRWDENSPVQAFAYGLTTAGNNAAHNNMPPYLAVYIWRRIA